MQGPAIVSESRGTPTAFPLKHQKKDLALACALAEEVRVQLPVAKAATALYEKVGLLDAKCCAHQHRAARRQLHGRSMCSVRTALSA